MQSPPADPFKQTSAEIEFSSPEESLPPELWNMAKGIEPLPEIQIRNESARTKDSSSGGIMFDPIPASRLVLEEPKERIWIWQNYLPSGGLVLLGGHPKAGKTTFAYHLARSVVMGEDFLGLSTRKCPVLILGLEEHRQDMATRVRNLRMAEDNLYLHVTPLKARAHELEAVRGFAKDKNVGLIIVDTLARFWTVKEENSASDVGASMAPILDLPRATNAAVLLLHHLRKGGGTEGEDIRGSGDLFANVDIGLTFKRRGDTSSQRIIQAFSRYNETPNELIVSLENGLYRPLGDPGDVRRDEQEQMIISALTLEPRDVDKIEELTQIPGGTLRTKLSKMARAGKVQETGAGVRGNPHCYSLTQNNSAESKVLVPCGINPPPATASVHPNVSKVIEVFGGSVREGRL